MKNEVQKYLEENIFPQYDTNIGGHGLDHILYTIERTDEIIDEFNLDVNKTMAHVIAAFHDIGYKINPDEHEKLSSELYSKDSKIRSFFTDEENKIIEEAIVDHRASLEYEPRSIYGKIISSADREISVSRMLERSFLFQKDKHAKEELTTLEIIEYSYKKLSSKYGKAGYAKMYFKDKKYLDYLDEMQYLLENKNKFIERELEISANLTKKLKKKMSV